MVSTKVEVSLLKTICSSFPGAPAPTDAAPAAAEPAAEADADAERAWMDHAHEVAHSTLFPKANSWYQGMTKDGRQVFMPYVGGVGAYREKCMAVADAGYEGLRLEKVKAT